MCILDFAPDTKRMRVRSLHPGKTLEQVRENSLIAPRLIASLLAFITDLLAAVPSIIFGLWGLTELMPRMQGTGACISPLIAASTSATTTPVPCAVD